MIALFFSACLALSAGGAQLLFLGRLAPQCLHSMRTGRFIARAGALVALGLGLAMLRGAA